MQKKIFNIMVDQAELSYFPSPLHCHCIFCSASQLHHWELDQWPYRPAGLLGQTWGYQYIAIVEILLFLPPVSALALPWFLGSFPPFFLLVFILN